jgi:hypothetical protein
MYPLRVYISTDIVSSAAYVRVPWTGHPERIYDCHAERSRVLVTVESQVFKSADARQWSIFYEAIKADKRWRPSTYNVESLLDTIDAAIRLYGLRISDLEEMIRERERAVS